MLSAIAFFVVHVVRSSHHRGCTASQCAKPPAPLYSESGDEVGQVGQSARVEPHFPTSRAEVV